MNDIITKRPENMDFRKYQELRREQKLRERRNRYGILVYVASVIYEDETTKKTMHRKFPPAVKSYDRNGNVRYVPTKTKTMNIKHHEKSI